MKEKRVQLEPAAARLKTLCRICLLRAGNDAFNDDLIDEKIATTTTTKKLFENNNQKKEINNEFNSIQKMFSIHQTMIGNYLVRDLISSITQLEVLWPSLFFAIYV